MTQRDKIVEAVRQKLLDRSIAGIQKYGTTLEREDIDLIDWLTHLQEELMDGANYCERAITEMKLYTAPQPERATGVQELPIELVRIAETLAEGCGCWVPCSGCHESNEGCPTGAYSNVLRCHLGNGCNECGGIGAIWDNADYSTLALDAVLAECATGGKL